MFLFPENTVLKWKSLLIVCSPDWKLGITPPLEISSRYMAQHRLEPLTMRANGALTAFISFIFYLIWRNVVLLALFPYKSKLGFVYIKEKNGMLWLLNNVRSLTIKKKMKKKIETAVHSGCSAGIDLFISYWFGSDIVVWTEDFRLMWISQWQTPWLDKSFILELTMFFEFIQCRIEEMEQQID